MCNLSINNLSEVYCVYNLHQMREKQSQAIGYVTKRYPIYNTPILQWLCSYIFVPINIFSFTYFKYFNF